MTKILQAYVVAEHEKCIGCKACELACFAEHNHSENHVGKTVGTVTVPVTPRLYLTKGEGFCMPIQCRHCEDAPCLSACTPKAIRRENGHILIDTVLCSGCKDCLMACPFGAIEMQPVSANGAFVLLPEGEGIKKAASKCDLCVGNPAGPACVRACKHEALRVVDVEADNEEKQIRAAQILTITQG